MEHGSADATSAAAKAAVEFHLVVMIVVIMITVVLMRFDKHMRVEHFVLFASMFWFAHPCAQVHLPM